MFAEVVTNVVSQKGGVAKVFASDSDYFHADDSGLDREMLRKRVGLEYKMLSMLPRLIFFAVCFGLFIAIQQVEYDPTNFSGIHLRLNDHFHLDNVYGIRQIPELIEYLDTFVISNAQLDPLNIYHWCAEDDALPTPVGKIRCRRDQGEIPDKAFLDHYNVYNQRIQDAQSEALLNMVQELRDAIITNANNNSNSSSGSSWRRLKEDEREAKAAKSPRAPRQRHASASLRPPQVASSEAASATSSPYTLANTSGIVGFALNGVLLIGAHQHHGHSMPTSWHFDDCGGHVDTDGHYHYHFPASCYLSAQGLASPGRTDWWAQPDPMAFWPTLSKPSPVLGYALDGVPIHGPYGRDGRLVDVSELDECNGRWEMNASGEKEYHYVWSVAEPFLPQCFRLRPAQVAFEDPGNPCRVRGEPSLSMAAPKGTSSKGEWLLLSHGCPDHPYFNNPMKAAGVAKVLDSERVTSVGATECHAGGNHNASYARSGLYHDGILRSLQSTDGNGTGDGVLDVFNPCAAVFDSANGESNDDGVTDVFNPCAAVFDTEDNNGVPDLFVRYRPFSMTASSVGFPFICQSRNVEKDCDSQFVDSYNAQKPNPVYNEPLNAPRDSRILRCRGEEYSAEPHVGFTPAVRDGIPYYCVFLDDNILTTIREFEWIDDLTRDIFVASFIYFPNADAVSLLRLDFAFENTGRIVADRRINTHSVLQDAPRWTTYLALQSTFLILIYARILFILVRCCRVKAHRRVTYDCLLTVLLGAFGTQDLLYRLVGEDTTMTGLVSLVNRILSVEDPSSQSAVAMVINDSFETLNVIKDAVAYQELMKLLAYFLVFMCLLRLIQHMEVHPKVDLISRTVMVAAGDMFHFCLIFIIFFAILAWLAHWSFGPDKIAFSTFRIAANTCFQMLIGEYPFEDEWTEGWLQKIWYILYTFLLFLVSLNILLAIIVESFLRVKQETEGRLEVKSLVLDLLSLPLKALIGFHHRWPSTRALYFHLEATRLWKAPVTAKELAMSTQAVFGNLDKAADLLRYYHWLLGNVVLDEKGREYEDYRAFVSEFVGSARAFSSMNFDMRSFLRKVVIIQSAFRRRIAMRRVDKLRRQRQQQLKRQHVALKELASTQLDLRNSPGNVIWLGLPPQSVEQLLLMQGGGATASGVDTDENTWTGSDSLMSAEDEGSGSGIPKRSPFLTDKTMTLNV